MTRLKNTEAGVGQTVAELEQQLASALAERDELLRQQAASAEILKVINSSPGNLVPVFDIILEKAHSLCDVPCGSLQLYDGDHIRAVAVRGMTDAFERFLRQGYRVTDLVRRNLDPDRVIQNVDLGKLFEQTPDDPVLRSAVEFGGIRTMLSVPLIKDAVVFGRIVAARQEVRPFSDHQIALLQSFAAQAVIAIDNARLFNETKEALEQQIASAEILKIINNSPGNLAPVFDIILEKAHSLCGAPCGSLQLYDGDHIRAVAVRGQTDAFERFLRQGFGITERMRQDVKAGNSVHIADLADVVARMPDDSPLRAAVELGGTRTMLSVPLIKDAVVFGRIVAARQEVRPFTEKQIALLQSFADQAVIAIENARLFNETKEALERQTASAEILKAINASPGDLAPVFDIILEKAHSLCDVSSGSLQLYEGDHTRAVAVRGQTDAFEKFLRQGFGITERMRQDIKAGHPVQIADLADVLARIPDELGARAAVELGGNRTMLSVPLIRDGIAFGRIVAARKEVRPFSDNQIALLQSFADQAVIAIENARLFNETREALERQTATADILKVIASSPDDVQPVFQAIAERSNRLLDGLSTAVYSLVDDVQHLMAFTPTSPAADATLKSMFPRPLSAINWGEAIRKGEIVRVPDIEDESAGPPSLREVARMRGWRSALIVPLLRDQRSIGTISVTRAEPGPFADRHVQLLQTFADQAVIAIENVRLFNETKEALEQQTATADILKVIASSPADVQPVFQAIAERSNRLVNGLSTTVLTIAGETVNLSAFTKTNPAADAALVGSFPRQLSAQSWGQPNLRGEIYCVPDTEADAGLRDLARMRGYRSMLFVPLLRDGMPIGMIGQTRVETGRFADQHVQLLKTFADQAVIAISNVRLFQEVQARTRELSQSLDDLRAAQDRLVQTEKLASLGQLTAGIAHEIKNPLNFVNNFSALSAELVGELDEALAPAALDQKTRGEVSELTRMLKGNLEKVVQHGKRADSIVKNMLLHSREGSGEHRVADINAIVDESLNLAYHGARAERSGFNIALKREFDPAAGMVDLYPQEITRVLLNLISNGFYAATKRKEAGDGNFEPLLSATTKGFGNRVEIRIRDNGTGIPLEVKEKMFNPFFTTKPAGEGTGLGLSMSHDIVVKQHGGTIDVDTEPGVFTEFIITLPRNAAARSIIGGTP